MGWLLLRSVHLTLVLCDGLMLCVLPCPPAACRKHHLQSREHNRQTTLQHGLQARTRGATSSTIQVTSMLIVYFTCRSNAMRGPRFEQTNMDFQPQPLSAMALIAEEPIRLMEKRIAECDGGAWAWNEKQATSDVSLARTGGGSLGHPKVFINLDKPGPKACS